MSYCFQDLKDSHPQEWQAYTRHEFVCQLGDGTLDQGAFRHYLQQDYLFLIQFARANALAVYKSRDMSEIRHSYNGLKKILDFELALHIDYCRQWGIDEAALARLPEARPTLAYTRYVLDTGSRGDLLDMHVALSPCLVGYGEVACFLNERPTTKREGNPYNAWIVMYESVDFQTAVHNEVEWLDTRLAEIGEKRMTELAEIFRNATRLEIDFWQMGLNRIC